MQPFPPRSKALGAALRLATLTALATLATACGSAALKAPPTADGKAEPPASWYFEEGSQAAARGDTARAEQYLAIAVDRGYDERRALPVLLSVCLRSSHLRAALNHAEAYLRNHPDDTELRYLVANIHSGLGSPERATRELERILRDQPAHARAHYLLAMLELDAGADGARAHLTRYLELEPEGDHAAEARGRLKEEP